MVALFFVQKLNYSKKNNWDLFFEILYLSVLKIDLNYKE